MWGQKIGYTSITCNLMQ